MAVHLTEIMNHELFCVRPDDRVEHVVSYFAALHIAAAPVVDDERRAVGFISIRDLVDVSPQVEIATCMTTPADTINRGATIKEAGTRLAEKNRHHLAVVDFDERVVGYIGALDVVRGLLGLPARHPDTFPHYDAVACVSWTNDLPLRVEALAHAPDGPGLLRLIRTRVGVRDRVFLSEATPNVRARVQELLQSAELRERILEHAPHDDDRVHFRTASTAPEDVFVGAAKAIGLEHLQHSEFDRS